MSFVLLPGCPSLPSSSAGLPLVFELTQKFLLHPHGTPGNFSWLPTHWIPWLLSLEEAIPDFLDPSSFHISIPQQAAPGGGQSLLSWSAGQEGLWMPSSFPQESGTLPFHGHCSPACPRASCSPPAPPCWWEQSPAQQLPKDWGVKRTTWFFPSLLGVTSTFACKS